MYDQYNKQQEYEVWINFITAAERQTTFSLIKRSYDVYTPSTGLLQQLHWSQIEEKLAEFNIKTLTNKNKRNKQALFSFKKEIYSLTNHKSILKHFSKNCQVKTHPSLISEELQCR